jgi:hypothetical protein
MCIYNGLLGSFICKFGANVGESKELGVFIFCAFSSIFICVFPHLCFRVLNLQQSATQSHPKKPWLEKIFCNLEWEGQTLTDVCSLEGGHCTQQTIHIS